MIKIIGINTHKKADFSIDEEILDHNNFNLETRCEVDIDDTANLRAAYIAFGEVLSAVGYSSGQISDIEKKIEEALKK